MLKVLSVKSRLFNKISKFIIKSGEYVLNKFAVFKCSDEIGFGKVVSVELIKNFEVTVDLRTASFRVATDDDLDKIRYLEKYESQILRTLKKQADNFIGFKILGIEYSFDRKKIYIYFSSEERVDFKIILRYLYKILKVWIEFRQVSVRDVAKFFGGVGVCGRDICCKTFLNSPKKINATSVANQNLYVGGIKFCGLCGRLMCCLEYEDKMYSKSLENMPNIGQTVNTPSGLALVLGVDAVSFKVKVQIIDEPLEEPLFFKVSELSY